MRAERVLVVDDSALTRAIVARTLAPEGLELQEAADGHAALALCAERPPDLVLLDVEMPGLDGYATLRALRERPELADVPVVLLTARRGPDEVAEGLRLGAHDHLGKPFEPMELLARARAALRTGRLARTLRERNAELERLVRTDPLTGLLNRRGVEERAAAAASRLRRHGGALGVVLLDVDAFKAINDTHGHATGDAVLVGLADRLRERLRAEDALARWGGEELLVVAPDTDGDGTQALAEALRAVVAARPLAGGLAVTVSCGWAAAAGGRGLPDLVPRADSSLYEAKRAGRDTVRGTWVSGPLDPA